VVLGVTFGMNDNYRIEYIKFEVVDFDSSYHAILGRPALAKFMAVEKSFAGGEHHRIVQALLL
jgi:hypothetical protein